ncbi:MAG: hypothetical protein ABIF92_00330 [archaeon]
MAKRKSKVRSKGKTNEFKKSQNYYEAVNLVTNLFNVFLKVFQYYADQVKSGEGKKRMVNWFGFLRKPYRKKRDELLTPFREQFLVLISNMSKEERKSLHAFILKKEDSLSSAVFGQKLNINIRKEDQEFLERFHINRYVIDEYEKLRKKLL